MGSEWREVTIGEIATIKHGFAFKGEYFTDEPQSSVLLTPGNFAVGGGFQVGKPKYYLGPIPADYVLAEGDLVVTMTDLSKASDTLGYAARVPQTTGTIYLHNQRTGLVQVKDSQTVRPEWLHYLMRTQPYRSWIVGSASGTTVKHTSPSRIGAYAFRLPPMVVQIDVASTLDAIEARIGLLRQTNITLEAIAQALFKSWFVDFDPVHAKVEGREPEAMDAAAAALFPSEFEESELGLIPKGWSLEPVGEMVEGIYDGPHATPPEADEGPIFLGIKNLTGSALDLSEIRHIAEDHYAQWTRRVTPRVGDIVFSYEATLGFFALIPQSMRCCLGRRLALIRPKQDSGYGHFWFHQFVASPFQRMLEKHTIQGATVNRISLKEFPGLLVLDPIEAIKSAFESMVAPLWKLIHSNQAKSETLVELRDTLLPRLISGKLRLPDAERGIEAVV